MIDRASVFSGDIWYCSYFKIGYLLLDSDKSFFVDTIAYTIILIEGIRKLSLRLLWPLSFLVFTVDLFTFTIVELDKIKLKMLRKSLNLVKFELRAFGYRLSISANWTMCFILICLIFFVDYITYPVYLSNEIILYC